MRWRTGVVLAGSLVGVATQATQGGADLSGQWKGTLTVDARSILSRAEHPNHRKLLQFAVKRTEKSNLVLSVYPRGRVMLEFSNGYPRHDMTFYGVWSATAAGIELMLYDNRIPRDAQPRRPYLLRRLGDTLVFDRVPGLPEGVGATFRYFRSGLPALPRTSPLQRGM